MFSQRRLGSTVFQLTRIRRAAQQTLLLTSKKRQHHLPLEHHFRFLDRVSNRQQVGRTGRIVVRARSSPSAKAAARVVVSREDREGSVGGVGGRGVAADDVGCEAGEEGLEGAFSAGRFDFLWRGQEEGEGVSVSTCCGEARGRTFDPFGGDTGAGGEAVSGNDAGAAFTG